MKQRKNEERDIAISKLPKNIRDVIKRKGRNPENNVAFLLNKTEEEKAWLAGLMDRSFQFFLYANVFIHRKNLLYAALEFETPDCFMAEALRKFIGIKYDTQLKGGRLKFSFRIQSKNAMNLIMLTGKYLNVKKWQAEFIKKFYVRRFNISLKEFNEIKYTFQCRKIEDSKELDTELINSWPKNIGEAYLMGYCGKCRIEYTGETDNPNNNKKMEESVDIFANRV